MFWLLMQKSLLKMNSTQLCRLCLETGTGLVNVFEQFEDSTIASVLATHFWFQINKDDGMPEWVCDTCWTHTETFHHFYRRLELRHQKHLIDEIKRERSVSPVVEGCVEADFVAGEYKEDTEITEETKDTQILSEGNSCDKDTEDTTCDQSEADDGKRCLMLDHIQYHDYPEEHRCEQCNETFSTRNALKCHAKNHVRTHQCSLCSRAYSSAASLKHHVRDKHPTDTRVELHCDICGKACPTKNSIISHMKYSHGPSLGRICEQDAEIRRFFRMACEICSDVEFDTLKKAKGHYRQVHQTKGYLICSCGRRFPKRYEMLDHIQYHIDPKAHRCTQCGKGFPTTQELKRHAKIHAPSRLKWKCELCSKFYATAAFLKYHVQEKHNTDTSVKFDCDICGKAYPTKNSITIHMKNAHGPSLGHICDGCGRKFKTKTDLKYHTEMEHSTTPPPKAQCDICGAWVKHKRYLRFHLRLHREEQDAQDGNAKSVNCPICEKKIQNKRLLAVHILKAHGERKHQCTFCDKAFKRPKNLKEHIALHTGVDLYSCMYCDKTFKSNANMYAHRKKSHLVEWTRDRTIRLGKL